MRRNRLWTGLASACSFLLVTSILGMNCMMSYQGTVNNALGILTSRVENPEGVSAEDTTYFESEYGELNAENLQKLISDTYKESVLEQEEGSVLLKNDNGALPLAEDERSITLFGHATAQPLYKANSAGSSGYEGEYNIDLYTALKDAGFEINDTLYNAYAESDTKRSSGVASFGREATEWALGEEDISFYTDEIRQSWEDSYNDVAIVMLSREGGEGAELYMEDEYGISQLALHQQEKDMLQMIKDSGVFEKTIVLINSGNAMELGWLDEYDVDACLWIGLPGQRGFEGVANLLTGDANPSGKLTDTYAVNSLSAPSVVNGGYHNQNWTNLDYVLEKMDDPDNEVSWYSVQAEGIYIGYKYYETRYEDLVLGQGNADTTKGSSTGEAWNYTDEVSYPFGYGLSYTSFDQTLDSVEINGDDITVTVTVTNTGETAGKSVVQIYAQTPYGEYEKENLVEKSAIQLLNFGKTQILEPGQSETLTITCDKYLLASYDYTNAKGYIMSEGDYYLSIGDNVHDALNNILAAKGASGMVDVNGDTASGNADKVYEWSETFDDTTYRTSQYSDVEVTNQFDDCDINYWIEDAVTYLSRNDWDATYPTEPVQIEATDEMLEVLAGKYYEKPEDAPSVDDFVLGEKQDIPLASLIGKEFNDEAWETYLNQFTLDELASLTADSFGTAEIPSVGKPAVIAGDGPDGVGGATTKFNEEKYDDGRDDCCYPCESILASTFNKELLQRRGELMAEEAMYLGVAQVWMPGVNLHRTPFGGRNFEYYSEDAVMTYLCVIPEVQAMEAKGVTAGAKHVAGNDQENNRQGISVFFNEQAYREGALRGCESTVTEGGGMAVMHAFNRLGMTWCSASEALCTQVLRNEWGFLGQQETDALDASAADDGYRSHFQSSIAAGTNTYCLDFAGVSSRAIADVIESTDDGYLLGKLRDSAHYYLYMLANSAIMNGYSVDSKVVSVTPWWQPTMYVVIGVFAVLDIIMIVLLVRSRKKDVIRVEEVQK